ncbi:hypothetical protein ACFSJU_11920 [Paradesertivirga mongoliensis]|uniref:Fimbrillin-A associated anchor protein Mfa1 and Mfa2 n=1 Tax=Paradesertivirga mongoliensis TaxID=2100740 RepID=A0ABW4ZNP0_9SPHI|nr:hypothetical protein [Pedobacter mongoliensis]
MKNIIFILLSSLALFSACKKDSETEATAALSEVTFSVSAFSEEIVPFQKSGAGIASTADSLRKYTDSIFYFAYQDQTYNLVKTGVQAKTDPNYGTITEKLPPGSYVVYFIATKGSINWLDETNINTANIGPVSGVWKDLFARSARFTVGSTPIQQTVNLSRQIGGIELKLLDSIPANASYLTLTTNNDATRMSVTLNVHSYGPMSQTFSLQPHIGKTNTRFFLYSYNREGSLEIKAYDASHQLIAQKSVAVNAFTNGISYVSGRLFTPNNVSFHITVDPVWNTPRTPITF